MEDHLYISESSLVVDEEVAILTFQQKLLKKAKSIASSPTTVWFVSLYFTVLISMISFNIFRVGFNSEGIFGGPSYYAKLFLYYGLNDDAYYDSPYLHGVSAWIFAPFIAVWLGVVLYFLTMGGYAFNGTTFSDPTGAFFFAFFNENVYGFEHNFFGEKGNLFYLGIIWIPILVSCIVTIYYKNWVNRETSIVTRFVVSTLISFWVGIEMAKMTDASIGTNWGSFETQETRTYVGILWFIIFLAAIAGTYYSKWLRRQKYLVTRVILLAIASFVVTLLIIKLFKLPVSIDMGGIEDSMTGNRHTNSFIEYKGEYHPTNLATVIFLYQVFVLIIFSLLDNLGNFIRYAKLQYKVIITRREMFLERRNQGILNLPWELEDETQKLQNTEAEAK